MAREGHEYWDLPGSELGLGSANVLGPCGGGWRDDGKLDLGFRCGDSGRRVNVVVQGGGSRLQPRSGAEWGT